MKRILKISPHYNLIENSIFYRLKVYPDKVFFIIVAKFGLNSVGALLTKTDASVVI
jgi:hypothetical protein